MQKHVTFWPLRYREDTGDDPDWDALGLPPNTGVYTVAGSSSGDFTHELTDLDGNSIDEAVGTFDTDDAGTADAVVAAINARILVQGAPMAQYVHEAIQGTGGVYYVHYKVDVPRGRQTNEFLVALTADTGTLTGAPYDRWPIATGMTPGKRIGGYPPAEAFEFRVRVVDVNDNFLANAGTYTAEVIEGYRYKIPPANEEHWATTTRGSVSGTVGEVHRVSVDGAEEIGVRISSPAALPVGADRLVIDWHPVSE